MNIENKDESLRLTFLNSAATLAQSTIKGAMLINGGAAVAVLAFIGNIWSKCNEVPESIAWSVASYSGGVLIAGIAMGTAYFTQYYYLENLLNEKGANKVKVGKVFRNTSTILIIGSFISFAIGTYLSFVTFTGATIGCSK